jgi:flagellin-like hook-associated protein FlgL
MKHKQLALAQSQLSLVKVQALKEYSADWLDGGQKVTRDEGGKFASKSRPGGPVDALKRELSDSFKRQFDKLSEEDKKQLRNELKISQKALDDIAAEIDKLPPEDQEKLKEFITSSDYKKAIKEASEWVSNLDKEAGKAFDSTVTKIESTVKKEDKLSNAFKKISGFVRDAVETAQEHPEVVACGAIAAGLAVAGGAGAVALFSLPNLFGIGGLYGGISAIMGEEAIGAIAGAFATGGLSQLGFGLCAYLAVGETVAALQNLGVILNKDLKAQYEKALDDMKKYNEQVEKDIKAINKSLSDRGLVTPDGYATPKYIKMLKKSGQLEPDYPDDKPYKIPYWKPAS